MFVYNQVLFLDIFSALESGYKGYLLHLSEEGWCPLKTGKSDRIINDVCPVSSYLKIYQKWNCILFSFLSHLMKYRFSKIQSKKVSICIQPLSWSL